MGGERGGALLGWGIRRCEGCAQLHIIKYSACPGVPVFFFSTFAFASLTQWDTNLMSAYSDDRDTPAPT